MTQHESLGRSYPGAVGFLNPLANRDLVLAGEVGDLRANVHLIALAKHQEAVGATGPDCTLLLPAAPRQCSSHIIDGISVFEVFVTGFSFRLGWTPGGFSWKASA